MASINTNVASWERIASVTLGIFLLSKALRKGSFGRIAGAMFGARLLYRGLSGHCSLYDALGTRTAKEI